jgi:hypothetical protein
MGTVTCIYVGAVLGVMLVILVFAIFVILLYVMFKLSLSCFSPFCCCVQVTVPCVFVCAAVITIT